MSAPYFVPVADLLPYWPHDLVAPSDVGILGRLAQYVGVTELDLIEYEGELVLTGKLALWQELALDLPLVDGVALVLGQPGPNLTALPFELDFGPASGDVAGGAAEKALDLFLKGRPGPYELLLPEVDVGLRFDPEKLRPMRPKDAADLSRGFEPDPAVAAVQLNFRAAVAINTETGVRLAAPGDLDLPYCQIGSTGVVIAARDLVFRLSDVQPFPEGIEPEAFDLEPDWKGVYLGRVQVFNLNTLVDWLPAVLDLEKWFIGRGGVSGKATAILDLAPDMSAQDFAVRAFRLAFRQNALIEGLVQLAVKLPYFDDKVVYLDLQITNEPELDFPASVGFMGAVSHHMKAVTVQNADGRMAFVGGVDLALGRWDTPEHLPDDERARGGRNPANDGFHDTHCMIEGPAVDDVETSFRQRWNAHPDAALGGRTPVPARPPSETIDPIPHASHIVQINRSLPPGRDAARGGGGEPGAAAPRRAVRPGVHRRRPDRAGCAAALRPGQPEPRDRAHAPHRPGRPPAGRSGARLLRAAGADLERPRAAR
jgi:hypothetical protein